jgi:hypothetical protein
MIQAPEVLKKISIKKVTKAKISNIKAQFEIAKHLNQTTFENLLYLQQTMF